MTNEEYADHLCALHGEACTQTKASHLIGRSSRMVQDMLNDGRLRRVCEGRMVDVRSIAEYIRAPKAIDSATRLEKRRRRDGVNCRFSV